RLPAAVGPRSQQGHAQLGRGETTSLAARNPRFTGYVEAIDEFVPPVASADRQPRVSAGQREQRSLCPDLVGTTLVAEAVVVGGLHTLARRREHPQLVQDALVATPGSTERELPVVRERNVDGGSHQGRRGFGREPAVEAGDAAVVAVVELLAPGPECI